MALRPVIERDAGGPEPSDRANPGWRPARPVPTQ